MPTRKASATWEGDLTSGRGTMKLGSGAFEGPFSFATRMGDTPGTNPEELIGAAEAGCFSMALAAGLGKAGFKPRRIQSSAEVSLDKSGEGFRIKAEVPGIDEKTFREHAEKTKATCPVSQALAGTTIELEARLLQTARS
jgi:lipoyl-dependent peroxiredoxin